MSTAQDLPPVASTHSRPSLALVPDPDVAHHETLATVTADTSITWDDTDFEAVLRKATPRLVRFAQRRLGNLHEAEEVSQEALLRTYQHRHTLATEDDVMAWATFASNRLVIDRLRIRGRSISVAELPEGRRVARDTAEIAEARMEARLALDALDALPARQAAVLWAREVEGSSYDEIGERYGLSEPTVRSLLHRARRALRREYASRGGTLPFAGVAVLGPWLNPLHNARRLRAAASAFVGTTALGVFSIGVFSIATPTHTTISAVPHSSPIHSAAAQAPIRDADVGKAVKTRTFATVVPATAISSAQVSPHPLGSRLPAACNAKSVGVNCSKPYTPRALWLRMPTGERIYVGSFDIGCNVAGAIPAATTFSTNLIGCDSAPSKANSKSPSGGSQ